MKGKPYLYFRCRGMLKQLPLDQTSMEFRRAYDSLHGGGQRDGRSRCRVLSRISLARRSLLGAAIDKYLESPGFCSTSEIDAKAISAHARPVARAPRHTVGLRRSRHRRDRHSHRTGRKEVGRLGCRSAPALAVADLEGLPQISSVQRSRENPTRPSTPNAGTPSSASTAPGRARFRNGSWNRRPII